MKQLIEQKKDFSSFATIQSYNCLAELQPEAEEQTLDFQKDHNNIFVFMNEMKAHKKKFKQLSETEAKYLLKVIKSLQSFLNQKKNVSLELIYQGLVEVAIITSIYQGKVQMIQFSLECIKKMVKFVEELEEDQELQEEKMIIEQPNRLTYQHKLGAILHMIIILICKTQKQKDIHYVKMLKKLFTPCVRQRLINIQLPKDEKVVKMYSVVLGYIGEKYNTKKIQKKITDKIIQLFVRVTHDKTLIYLANYLRERCLQIKADTQYLVKIGFIEKLKLMIKLNRDKPHISHLLDLYTRLMAYCIEDSQYFYDQQMMFMLTQSRETILENNPNLILTTNYNKIVTKLLSQFLNVCKISQSQAVKLWCKKSIIQHFEKLDQKKDNEFSLKIISLLFYIVSQQTLLNLFENNFIQRIFDLASVSNDKLTLIIMHIAHKLFKNGANISFWLNKVLIAKILQNLSKIDKSTVHYIIVQQIKKFQEMQYKIVQEQDLIVK